MEIKVYADILFIVNLAFDYCILSFTSALLRLKPKIYRLIIASALGATYAVTVFFASPPFLSSYVLKLLTASIMISVAFGIKSPRTFFKRLCVFYLTALSMGGICFALFSESELGSRLGAVYSSGVLYINIPAYKLILAAVILHFILRTAVSAAEKANLKASKICFVQLSAFDKSLPLPALYDTGNFLSDSKTGLGVCIAQWSAVMPFFADSSSADDAAQKHPEKFKLISCKVIGGKQWLYAFYADVSLVSTGHTTRRLIAITTQNLTNDRKYSLILPNDFEGANINDGTSFKRHFKHSKNQVFTAKKST